VFFPEEQKIFQETGIFPRWDFGLVGETELERLSMGAMA
jgi:hypothetical protein